MHRAHVLQERKSTVPTVWQRQTVTSGPHGKWKKCVQLFCVPSPGTFVVCPDIFCIDVADGISVGARNGQ